MHHGRGGAGSPGSVRAVSISLSLSESLRSMSAAGPPSVMFPARRETALHSRARSPELSWSSTPSSDRLCESWNFLSSSLRDTL